MFVIFLLNTSLNENRWLRLRISSTIEYLQVTVFFLVSLLDFHIRSMQMMRAIDEDDTTADRSHGRLLTF